MYPAIEIDLHLDRTCPAQRQSPAALEAALRALNVRHQPAPPSTLLAAGYQVYAINPMSVARYRERHSTSGTKSDPGDAHVLAEIVRLDHVHHRQVAGDSPIAEAVKLLARAHQSLIWDRTRQVLRLRSARRAYVPGPATTQTACLQRGQA